MAEKSCKVEEDEEFFDWDDLVRLAEKEKEEDGRLAREMQEQERFARLEEVRRTEELSAEDLKKALEGDGEVNDEIEIKQEIILDPNE